MDLYLPIAGLSVNALVIVGLGGLVGFLSGMFGVGGGFLTTPLLMFYGIPPAGGGASAARPDKTAAEPGDPAAAATAFQVAAKQLDKAASKGVIHKNQAANRKSGLAKQVAGL